MLGFVVFSLCFMLGRLAAVPLFVTAIAVRGLGTSHRMAWGIALAGAIGLAPAAWLYFDSDDPWEAMSLAGGGPWLDVTDGAMLVITAFVLILWRRSAPDGVPARTPSSTPTR